MELSERDKSRVRFHLGYADYAGIQAGEVEQLEFAMSTVRDEIVLTYVRKYLDTLDAIFDARDPTNPDSFTQIQLFAGDINRTRTDKSPIQTMELWDKIYNKYADKLAQALYVTNFNNKDYAYRFARGSSSYINAVKGMAVPNVGSRIFMHSYLA
jgi:hypothetical protein